LIVRVFLSFTSELSIFPSGKSFVDAARDGVIRAGCAVTDMRDFVAREEPPVEACREEVLRSDVYVGVIGMRYGSRVRDRPELSYTELEFDIATEAGLPRLIFLLDEDEAMPIPVTHLTEDDQDSRTRQQRFRQKLTEAGMVRKTVATAVDLGHEVERAVQRLVEASRPGRSGGTARPPSRRPPAGREKEIDLVAAAWLAAPPEPVAVLGMAGIGKSAVCLAALEDDRVRDRFGPRRWFIRCDGVGSAQALIPALAATLGVIVGRPAEYAEQPGRELTDRVFATLKAGPGVMVLDNFETPWHEDPLAVEDLLGRMGSISGIGLAVAIRGTARPAVLPWRVATIGQLPLPAARQMFLAIAGPDLASAPNLDALLSELDGMPLAVELLGYVAQGEPRLTGVAERWRRERTGLLERSGGERRELSVAVSVEASAGSSRMTEQARRLFAMLGMLPDGASLADIDALMPDDGSAAAAVLQQRLGLAFYEDDRLRLLAPVRYYAASSCPPTAGDLARVIAHYVALAAATEAPVGGREAVARLNTEIGNVTGLLNRVMDAIRVGDITQGAGIDEFVNGLCGLIQYWILTGAGEPRLIMDADELMDVRGTERHRACLSRAIADLALARSDYRIARVRYAVALPLFQQVQDVLGEANCRKGIGDVDLAQYEYEAAMSAYLEALPLYQQVESPLGEANCIKSLGNIALEHSELESARTRYEAALPLYQQAGSVLGAANCIRGLGDVEFARSQREAAAADRYQAAAARYEEALALYRQARSVLGEAHCIQRLGDVAMAGSHHEAAAVRYEEALPLYRRVGGVLGEANCIKSLGDVAAAFSDHGTARARYRQALDLYQNIEDFSSMGWTHLSLARLESPGLARNRHLEAACRAWTAIGRDDLIERELR
jgi:tetratricopeptide (TPR) repeat protein